ncbi:syntabulin isoform X2 [Thalassophryne amazonica]|uniref:syntabulin isoform X2 n=1 Tax=Thalassophryne amazonica TaxID=390379 RepID=UPI001471DFA2|nr:syntabulin isoform X2 [Thalassophryne amazonica]
MGLFQEYEEKKSAEKGSTRSRIPRLILHPFKPKIKGAPLCDSPLSEEEGKECDISSDHSKQTISTNSFCSGSETDFSSSSSTGSLKTRETLGSSSVGKMKAPSRSSSTRIRPLPIFKPAGIPTTSRVPGPFTSYRTPPRAAAAATTPDGSCSSSPTSRGTSLGRYLSCGENHGIRPPNPEQYLTPLQQKEVSIRHLKAKLLESENRVCDRESEIEELKAQLSRMREDWIEEECHRVEAQLSLKEARKEIKQLRQVVETMKSSLMEKDKGIQKYFIDINIQNRKLESLLQSMELAQSGINLQEEHSLDFLCDNLNSCGKKVIGEEDGGLELEEQGAEALADSGLLVNDEMANRADILEQVFMSTATDFSQDSMLRMGTACGPGVSTLTEEGLNDDPNTLAQALPQVITNTIPVFCSTEDKGVQTDMAMCPDLQVLLLQLLKIQNAAVGDAAVPVSRALLEPTYPPVPATVDNITPPLPSTPNLVLPESHSSTLDSGICCSEPGDRQRFMEELDFGGCEEKPILPPGLGVVSKSYWSNSFLIDLVAVVVPVLPTLAWLYSQHGVDRCAPVYNIAALIRGCCIMGLHSLRHISHRPDV